MRRLSRWIEYASPVLGNMVHQIPPAVCGQLRFKVTDALVQRRAICGRSTLRIILSARRAGAAALRPTRSGIRIKTLTTARRPLLDRRRALGLSSGRKCYGCVHDQETCRPRAAEAILAQHSGA